MDRGRDRDRESNRRFVHLLFCLVLHLHLLFRVYGILDPGYWYGYDFLQSLGSVLQLLHTGLSDRI